MHSTSGACRAYSVFFVLGPLAMDALCVLLPGLELRSSLAAQAAQLAAYVAQKTAQDRALALEQTGHRLNCLAWASPPARQRNVLPPDSPRKTPNHSHSIVNRRVRLMGRSGALTGRSERDTDIRTVASLAIIEVESRRSLPACRSGRRTWDRLGSKLTTLTVSIGLFSDAVTVLAGPMTVFRLRLPDPRNGRARVSCSRLRAGGERPTRRRWRCPRSRTAPGSQIVRKE